MYKMAINMYHFSDKPQISLDRNDNTNIGLSLQEARIIGGAKPVRLI